MSIESKGISLKLYIPCILMVVACGCSDEAIKRTTYETLQNIRDKECSKQPSVECEKRESLEIYQEKIEQVKNR